MAPPYDTVIVRYGEIALKGPSVRRSFEERLRGNISDCLNKDGIDHVVESMRGRILVRTSRAGDACRSISRVFGIVTVSPAISTSSCMEDIVESTLSLARSVVTPGKSFAVSTNRGDKSFPITSQEVSSRVGETVRVETGGRVDLGNPDVVLGVDVREETYIFRETLPGPGGLPLGTAGRVMSLFSGGIDSPVGAYLMMKRGCESHLLYMDNSPYADVATTERAVGVAQILSRYSCGFEMKLFVAPYGHVLRSIIENCPRRLTCTLCKRMMTRIAGAVAGMEGCDAVMNGSSLAQVCSQTMPNLALTLSVGSVPVLMPLLGFDKDEIISIARRIGTYDSSSTRTEGCTAVPRHPKINPTPGEIEKAELELEMEKLIAEAIGGIQRISLSPEG